MKSDKSTDAIDTQTKLLLLALLIVICLIVYGILNQKSEELTKETIDAFNESKELICKESPIVNSKALLVSKNRGWEIYGEYFKKDEILLNMEICKSAK